MKTSSPFPLAVLSTTPEPVAVLSLDLNVDDNGWQQLLPAGLFRAVDGRPFDVPGHHWFIDADIAADLIALANDRLNEVVIDYEHQTLKAEDNGLPAPAAGWFKTMEWREGSGLWIKPQWTPRATDFIKNGEYKYLSAVFPYDAITGRPLRLHSAALVNRPGIDGLQAVEALAALSLNTTLTTTHPTEHSMNELLKKMLAQLGITVEDGKEPDQAAALAALSAQITKAATVESLATQVAALKANDNGGTVDPAKYVPVDVMHQLHAQIAVLSAEGNASKLDQTIDKAKQEGRIVPAMEAWARDLGKQDMAALQAFLDKSKPIAALAAMQTDGTKPDADNVDPLATLSADEKKVCLATGISEADFFKTKKGDA
ncbi:phage protease [Neptunomonas antarctica]|uniref:phage protease n=1 Tax=Neptunomonas antarctica TaxID=619304 RepID=UPI0006C77899|nr:phage protease [Neptunomonas antarctica]